MGFGLLYGLHGLAVDEASARPSLEFASTSFSKTLLDAGLFPRLPVLLVSLRSDVAFWAFWIAGAAIVARGIWNAPAEERWCWLEVAGLALPVASLIVYRNSFSYFYPTVLAPGSVLTAVAWHALTQSSVRRNGWAMPAVIKLFTLTWFTASVIFHGLYVPTMMPLQQQRTILAEVHRTFPSPIPYLDSRSMVASFPQVGFFMSTWGMEAYSQRGESLVRKAIEERQPPLLLANHPLLDPENAVFPASLNYRPPLVESDRQALAAAYIHHWGPIYVAGKRLRVRSGVGPTRFDLLIGGRYTVDGHGPVRIDGNLVQPGQSLDLTRGDHWIAAVTTGQRVILRWGESLYRSSQPPPEAPLFFLGY
jgi:hypothetical protein